MLLGQPIRQIAYAAADVRAAALEHSRLFGSGPFLLIEDFPMTGNHRGEEVKFSADCAMAQWGELMIEIINQKTPGPGPVPDLYPHGSGRSGIHHVCSIVKDIKAATAEFARAGHEVAFHGLLPLGSEVVLVDTVDRLGHFTEFYEPTEEVLGMYDVVRGASAGFDGSDPIRSFWDYIPGGKF